MKIMKYLQAGNIETAVFSNKAPLFNDFLYLFIRVFQLKFSKI